MQKNQMTQLQGEPQKGPTSQHYLRGIPGIQTDFSPSPHGQQFIAETCLSRTCFTEFLNPCFSEVSQRLVLELEFWF